MPSIPKNFHFIFGLREQDEPFHLAWYLCLKSCLVVNKPDRVFFHYKNTPYGPWWDLIKPELELACLGDEIKTGIDESLYATHSEGRFIQQRGYQYAHHADVLRLEILAEQGGVYADIDTLFVKPYPDEFYHMNALMGRESEAEEELSLCNAVIMAQPHQPFIKQWLESIPQTFDGTWNKHSCYQAARLSEKFPDSVSVVDKQHFFHLSPTREGLTDLFARSVTLPDDLYSIHLWSHLWWDLSRTDFVRFHQGMLTEQFIESYDSTYNLIARRFLA